MGRFYRLSKTVNEEQANQILTEFREIPGVVKVEMNEELNGVSVFVEDDNFADVMNVAVNIFDRQGGADLSFDHFIYED